MERGGTIKRAVALSGGGSRGAYELGVWRSLLENNVDYQLVTGTSIGSLNGALMAQRDYELTRKLWESLTVDMVMEDGINLEYSIQRMLDHKGDLKPFLKKYVHYKGADIGPLRELVSRVIDEERVRASEIGFGLVTVQVPSLRPLELLKEDIPAGRLREYLLASASCFPAFPMCKVDGKTYIDGGYYDNLPISFALRSGAEEVVAVDLDDHIHHKEYYNSPCVLYIKPSWNLGSILLFRQEVMAENTALGYNDAQKVLGGWFGFRYTFRQPGAERETAAEAARFCSTAARLEAGLSAATNALLKLSLTPLTDSLAEGTFGRRLSPFQCLLRSLELCAELLELDHLRVYGVQELARLLWAELSGDCGLDAETLFQKLRGIKLPADFLSAERTATPRQLLSCVAGRLKTASAQDLEWLASALPRELAATLGAAILCGQFGGF